MKRVVSIILSCIILQLMITGCSLDTKFGSESEQECKSEKSNSEEDITPIGEMSFSENVEVEKVSDNDNALNPFIITIKGNEYDMTGDPNEIIGCMSKDGITVIDAKSNKVYGEDGYIDEAESIDFKNNNYSITDKSIMHISYSQNQPEIAGNINLPYIAYIFDTTSSQYRNGENIYIFSTKEDVEKLDGYVKFEGFLKKANKGAVAVYFDDMKIDLEDYSEEYDSFIAKYIENSKLTPDDSNRKSYNFYATIVFCSFDAEAGFNQIKEIDPELVPSTIKVTNALMDGHSKIKNGEINRMYLVWYSSFEDNSQTNLALYVYGGDQFVNKKETE